jgi:hypothetical protein
MKELVQEEGAETSRLAPRVSSVPDMITLARTLVGVRVHDWQIQDLGQLLESPEANGEISEVLISWWIEVDHVGVIASAFARALLVFRHLWRRITIAHGALLERLDL